MEAVEFLPDDPLFRAVGEAYDAVHKLSVQIHYLGCGMKPWKPPPNIE
jgi:hypothetical protein